MNEQIGFQVVGKYLEKYRGVHGVEFEGVCRVGVGRCLDGVTSLGALLKEIGDFGNNQTGYCELKLFQLPWV